MINSINIVVVVYDRVEKNNIYQWFKQFGDDAVVRDLEIGIKLSDKYFKFIVKE